MQYTESANNQGTLEQQVAQLRIQMLKMQEETEDAIRNMKREIQTLRDALQR